MNNNYGKKIGVFFVLILIVGLLSLKLLPKEKEVPPSDMGLRVGAGDDITGVLLHEIIKSYGDKTNKPTKSLEDDMFLHNYTFKDC